MHIRGRWWVLALIAVVIAGNYYAWDSIAPVADLLRRQLGFSQSQIGLLNAVYNLTGHDVREQARFDDAIGIFPEFIDGYGILILPTTGRYFQVPYRALLPKGVDNLLVAGRSIGGDKTSHAAVRNMMCCAVAGQGAGVAAAISARTGQPFDQLDIARVQAELKRQGARIH